MWEYFYHYIYQDIWLPVWPNWFAALPVSIYGVVKVKAWDKRRTKEHKDHMDSLNQIHKHLGIGKYNKLRKDNHGKVNN